MAKIKDYLLQTFSDDQKICDDCLNSSLQFFKEYFANLDVSERTVTYCITMVAMQILIAQYNMIYHETKSNNNDKGNDNDNGKKFALTYMMSAIDNLIHVCDLEKDIMLVSIKNQHN